MKLNLLGFDSPYPLMNLAIFASLIAAVDPVAVNYSLFILILFIYFVGIGDFQRSRCE
jgi:hypothetical protein